MHSGLIEILRHFVNATKLHPVLVNFTAALVPVSVASDWAGRRFNNDSLTSTAWWSLLYAVVVTPFTALSGWLFWMKDDNGVTGMAVHKWLGTAFVFLLAGLFLWRRDIRRRGVQVSVAYLVFGLLVVAAVAVQGHLGGMQVFSGN